MKTYYYVPPCPKCGSKMTGRFVFPVLMQKQQMLLDAYANGELVAFYDRLKNENAFCAACGYEWNAKIETTRLTDAQIQQEKQDRHVDEVYDETVKQAKAKKENWGAGRKFIHSITGF